MALFFNSNSLQFLKTMTNGIVLTSGTYNQLLRTLTVFHSLLLNLEDLFCILHRSTTTFFGGCSLALLNRKYLQFLRKISKSYSNCDILATVIRKQCMRTCWEWHVAECWLKNYTGFKLRLSTSFKSKCRSHCFPDWFRSWNGIKNSMCCIHTE